MNKVMSRTAPEATANRTPRHRPPTRHDTRRPGGTPPRKPSIRGRHGMPPTAPRNTGTALTTPETTVLPTPETTATARPETRALVTPETTAPTRPKTTLPPVRPTDVFADRLLAVLSGQRPVHWMLRHTAGRAYDDLTRLAERSPLRTRGARPVVHDIGYYVPSEGALEVFARIAAGDQLRALAFRLERGQDRRWRCTAVETGPRPQQPPLDT
ncbi:Rv3235 family protein [Streptomyces puniciscabiei]|uniref:Rv3235 family protein n=1 Tax=Streptomyces puniciscabiei TaxID=164348 RepID=UPI00332C4A7C